MMLSSNMIGIIFNNNSKYNDKSKISSILNLSHYLLLNFKDIMMHSYMIL